MVNLNSLKLIMVKRACPFSDDMNPQFKVHVSEKEVAEGVMSDHHMQNVYDKTKELLFLGAKKVSAAPLVELSKCISYGATLSVNLWGTTSLKQMELTSQGQLSIPKNTKNEQVKENITCSRCSAQNPPEVFPCFFCDLLLCLSCTQSCIRCCENFCAACSFNMYDGSESYICRNCC